MEDEMHILFLCPFSKAAWYCHPWYIRTETLAALHYNVPDMIQALLSSSHPQINPESLYTFLWCLWKARNDCRFNRKCARPTQVFAASNAIVQGSKIEGHHLPEDHESSKQPHPSEALIRIPSNLACNSIFCDAAWKLQQGHSSAPAGIGIFIQMEHGQHCKHLYVSAMSPTASSALQAEAFGLVLATKIADLLNLQEPHFYTDSSILASAAAATSIVNAPGHWAIRPLLASIQASNSFHANKISHIHRSSNVKAHHQARLATKIKSRTLSIRCLSSDMDHCPGKDILSVSSVNPFTLLSVKCA
jgi:hypothetical protein